jgi:hypothetical protein
VDEAVSGFLEGPKRGVWVQHRGLLNEENLKSEPDKL